MRGTSRIEPLSGDQVWLNTGTLAAEWLCSEHWRRVPRAWKRRLRLFQRRMRKLWPDGAERPTGEAAIQHDRIWRLYRGMWKRCVEAASGPRTVTIEEIERIFGVAP